MTAAITDFTQFHTLRSGAEKNDPEVLREVAGQFEALFVQTMLKSMRDAKLAEGIFGESDQHDMYQDMLDQQFAVNLSTGRGVGLADMLVRQLEGATTSAGTAEKIMQSQHPDRTAKPAWQKPEDFARDIWPHAEKAAQKLRVPPEGLVAQAALETGWGRHVMQRADGGFSFNLFGIKAGSSWSGPVASKRTLEFVDGTPEQQLARFRAYPDIESTFEDYVRVVGTQPRFDAVRDHADDPRGFAEALQASGYATDPAYADKIAAIVNSKTMQRALADVKSAGATPINTNQVGDSI